MKKWFKAFAVMGACAFMLGTMGVASADEYEGYDEDGNYAVVAEGAEAAPTRRLASTERRDQTGTGLRSKNFVVRSLVLYAYTLTSLRANAPTPQASAACSRAQEGAPCPRSVQRPLQTS